MTKTTVFLLVTAAAFIASHAFADSVHENVGGDITNTNTNVATGGAGGAGGSAHATGGTAIAAPITHNTNIVGGAESSANNTGNTLSVDTAAQKRAPVATAFAAPLVAADDTCMGSSSAGGQAVGFGLSVGSTWKDGDCVRRKDARELYNMKQHGAALALLCQSAEIAEAMDTAGTPCPGKPSRVGELSPGGKATHSNSTTAGVIYEYPTSGKRW